jgi:tRNA A37 threonylcarbamoyladenosine modification protein TsaB
MFKIIIDATDTKNRKVQLISDGTVIAEKTGDIDLVLSITDLLQKHSLAFSQVDSYENVSGKGSFTGIKTGAAIANTLNWAAKYAAPKDLHYPAYDKEPNIQR